jgi:hypothetical protein
MGQVNLNGLCCNIGQVNFNGLCAEKCPNSHINVDGICSKCENNQVPNSKQTACICPRSHVLENDKCHPICEDGKIPNTDFGTNKAGGTGGIILPCICPKGQAYLDFTFVVLGQLIEKFKCQDCPRGEIPNKEQTACVTPNIKDPISKVSGNTYKTHEKLSASSRYIMVFGGRKTKILDMVDSTKKCDDLENAPDFSEPYLVGTELTSGSLFNGKPVI